MKNLIKIAPNYIASRQKLLITSDNSVYVATVPLMVSLRPYPPTADITYTRTLSEI